MLNRIIVQGRLTSDVKENSNGIYGSIACQRNYKNKEGTRDADFINISAYGKTAEFIKQFFHKGDEVLLEGNLNTFRTKDGAYSYTVNVDRVNFVGSAGSSGAAGNTTAGTVPAVEEENTTPFGGGGELPF